MGRLYVSKTVAITPSIRFDNFINKVSNTRSEDYLQYKIGVAYDDNVLGKVLGKYLEKDRFTSYSLVDFGIASKVKSKLEGKKNTFAFSVGYGFKGLLSKKLFFDSLLNWGSVSSANSAQGSWFDFRFGFGLYL